VLEGQAGQKGRQLKDVDRSLVRACQAGDREAWETLILRYQRLLYAIPLRCGLSEDDAADVFQTVCVKLLENLEKLRDEQHLTGWLITTAKHEAWRVHRLKRRHAALDYSATEGSGEDGLDTLPAPDPLPHEAAVRLEEEQLVRVALGELGERCQTLLRWLYHTDPALPYAEIAARLNVSVGAIGPTRARCLQQLRKVLHRMDF